MTAQALLLSSAAACFAAFVALGIYVARRPLAALDVYAASFHGHATRLALMFTLSGRLRGVTAGCIIASAAFVALRKPLWIPATVILSQVLSQSIVEFVKTRYTRTRPEYWLVRIEAGHSYPSGHATTAMVFFIGWAVVVAFSALQPEAKAVLVALLVLWALGVAWSRLALGAHYLSDVVGGVLFGSAWLCALAAGIMHVVTHSTW